MKKGKQFELAVYEFAKTLSPHSNVYFDHKVKDRDTNTFRQVDVWIETTISGHIPLSVLISCKDYKRKLDIGHIGTFVNEVRSTGASTGILYSKVGFTAPALKKAKSNGLSCCRLYENSPPDIPDILVFNHYLCAPRFRFNVYRNKIPEGIKNWGQLFDLKIWNSDENVIQYLLTVFKKFEKEIKFGPGGVPLNRSKGVEVKLESGFFAEIEIVIEYRHYQGKLEAHLVKGSYCLTNDNFRGTLVGPSIDMKGTSPGSGWKEIKNIPDVNNARVVAILSGGWPDEDQFMNLRKKDIVFN